MEVRVLGSLEVRRDDGAPAALPRPVHRRLLAALALAPGREVGADRLVDVLWPGDPPATAVRTLHSHVARLRAALGPGAVGTTPGGYRLACAPDDVDAVRFEALAAQGRAALRDGHVRLAEHGLSAALALWRGPAFDGLRGSPAVDGEAARLEELRVVAREDLAETRLLLGEVGPAVADLEPLAAEHPLRESVAALRIRALYLAGRQGDALAAYAALRTALREELGLDPAPGTTELRDRVLRQDPGLRPRAAEPQVPAVRYARNGRVSVAFQVLGEGPVDLLYAPSYLSHLEVVWEHPAYAAFLRRLASTCRLALFDKRGMGLSDRVPWATGADREDDVQAVLDAAGMERAFLLGSSEGGGMAASFAASHPERVRGLVLFGVTPALARPDFPHGPTPQAYERSLTAAYRSWGTGRSLEVYAPSAARDPEALAWYGRMERQAVSPSGYLDLLRLASEIDWRPVLPRLRVPTLVLHREDEVVPLAAARYLAEQVPGARLQVLPGVDHLIWFGDHAAVTDAVEAFVREVVAAEAAAAQSTSSPR